MFLLYSIFVILTVTSAVSASEAEHVIKKRFDWHDEGSLQWSMNCDFFGSDLSDVQVPGEQCGPKCEATQGCTHFTWTGHNGGTCWLKQGGTSLDKATHLDDNSVCGRMKGGSTGTQGGGDGNFQVINNCDNPVWVAAQGNPLPFEGGFKLDAKSSRSVNVDPKTKAGRIWGRTGCSDQNGRLVCDTGDCGAGHNNFGVECKGIGGKPPATLAEFTLAANGQDYYDISNVDGYNVGMKMEPMHANKVGDSNLPSQFNCGAPLCTMDMSKCPEELKITDKNGRITCASICSAIHNNVQREKFPHLQNIFNDKNKRGLVCCSCDCGPNCGCSNPASKYCCSPYNKPSNIEKGGKCRVEEWPRASDGQRYDEVFKNACPDAYSWQFDDHKSTYLCKSGGYKITFCP